MKNDDTDNSSNNAIISFVKNNPNKTICYCNGGDRSHEKKIREIIKDSNNEYEYYLGGIEMISSDVISFVKKV